jgi:hypothetical protein
MSVIYDYFETILETLFETFYIFLWIIYVNNYFFKYNKRMKELEVETVGLRRMVYAFLDDKTKTKHFSRNNAIVPLKKNEAVLTERMTKLKKMMISLREELDELKCRVDDLEDEDYEPSSHNENTSESESDSETETERESD